MSYSVDNITKVTINLSQQGIGNANFATAVLFAKNSEVGMDVSKQDKLFYFTSLDEVTSQYPTTSETYQAAAAFLGGIPVSKGIYIWNPLRADTDVESMLNKARANKWWFFTFFTESIYKDKDKVKKIAAWAEASRSYFANCQHDDTIVTNIRKSDVTSDLGSELTALGLRFTRTLANKESKYAAIAETKWFASVNYNNTLSTITGEYKPLASVQAEDLTSLEMVSMKSKNVGFYSKLDLQGSTTDGKVINSKTHSGVYIDDVINIEAFTNSLKTALCNAIITQPTKLPQTPAGQQVLIDAATLVGEQYIRNGFLGSRTYTVPETGKEKITRGYEISTVANDILNISQTLRDNREGAPITMTIFTAGGIHEISMITNVF